MLFRIFVIFVAYFAFLQKDLVALVGLDNDGGSGNIPGSNIATKNKPKLNKSEDTNKKTKGKNNKNNKDKKQENNKGVITGAKPSNVPDFPDDEDEYKMLFDDGFSNVVENVYQTGEEFDVFVNQNEANNINKKYFSGNDNDITQMDAINAEKKTMVEQNFIDKNNVKTHRTRVMAYLTLDQMLFADLFGQTPHGYYVNAVNKKG